MPKLTKAIEEEIIITREKLSLIDRKKKEKSDVKSRRKFVFTLKELGREATWLADDLKRFMPLLSKEKWRGYHHSQLQQSLAYFDQKPKEAYALLHEFWNLEDTTYPWNSGIRHALMTSRNFDDLYEKHLNSRRTILENILSQLKGFASNKKLLNRFIEQQHIWTIFYKRLYIIDKTDEQIKKLLAKPLVFPRGIFDSKPTYIHQKKITESPELYADWYRYIYQAHEYQRFYQFERYYKDLYTIQKWDDVNNKYNLSDEEKFLLFKQKQDKIIKQIKIQDLYLKLIAENIFDTLFKYNHPLSLKDFYLTQEERKEKNAAAFKQSQRTEGDSYSNIINDNFLWSKTIPYANGQINEPAIKLKDIGKFKRFLEDEKVMRLFSYDPERVWKKLELEQELNLWPTSYEVIRREHILKELQNLEKSILEAWGYDGINHPKEFERDGSPNFNCYVVEGILRRYNLAEQGDMEFINSFEAEAITSLKSKPEIIQKAFLLIYIRNKFAHNQLPGKEHFELMCEYLPNSSEGIPLSYSQLMLNFTIAAVLYFRNCMHQ